MAILAIVAVVTPVLGLLLVFGAMSGLVYGGLALRWLFSRIVMPCCDRAEPVVRWLFSPAPARIVRNGVVTAAQPVIVADRWLQRGRIRRWLVWPYRICTPLAAAVGLLLCWALIYVYLWPGDQPDTSSILKYEPLQIGHLTDAKGNVYYRSFDNEARVVIAYEKVPVHVRNAFIAAEDGDYWRNDGWDRDRTFIAICKAAFSKAFRFRPQGASGITQQVMRKLDPVIADLTRRERNTELISTGLPTRIVALIQGPVFANQTARKWREIKRSVNMESALKSHFRKTGSSNPHRAAKEAILGTYLNEVYFGHGVYGVGYAAKFFFQEDVANLTVDEAALLASLLPSPARYADLRGDPTALKTRRDQVLTRMAREGFLNGRQWKHLVALPVRLDVRLAETKTEAPAAVNTVLFHELPKIKQTREKLLRGSIQVETTLQMDVQRIINRAVHHGLYGDGTKDSGWVGRYPGIEVPQVAVVALGPRGEILGMYGGEARVPEGKYRAEMQLNRVYALEHPGSTIKIVDNLAALMAGFTPDQEISDADLSWCMRKNRQGRCIEWKSISNYESKKYGKLPWWEWSARSINTPYARLMRDMVGNTKEAQAESDRLEDELDRKAGYNVGNIDPGAAWMLKWAKEMGIETPLQPYISSVLGGSDVTVLDMANVIHSAGTGNRAMPHLIRRITDSHGKTLYENNGQQTPLLVQPEQMVQLQALLSNNVRNPEGTGHSLDKAAFGIEVGGKTGTSDGWRDAWYCGYNPGTLFVCIHVGYDDNTPMPGEGLPIYRAASGGWVALPIFREIMKESLGPGKPLGIPNSMPEPVKEMVTAYLDRAHPERVK